MSYVSPLQIFMHHQRAPMISKVCLINLADINFLHHVEGEMPPELLLDCYCACAPLSRCRKEQEAGSITDSISSGKTMFSSAPVLKTWRNQRQLHLLVTNFVIDFCWPHRLNVAHPVGSSSQGVTRTVWSKKKKKTAGYSDVVTSLQRRSHLSYLRGWFLELNLIIS